MKFQKHLSLLASAAVIAGVVPALTAQAQGVTCTLSTADCQLISDARANILKETSFVPTFNFKLALTGEHAVNIQATGTGAFAFDTTANLQDHATLLKAVQMQLDISGTSTMGTLQISGKTGLVIKDGVIYGLNPADNAWLGVDLTQIMTMMQTAGRTPTVRPNAMQGMMQQMMADPDVKAALMALPNIKGFITQQRMANDATLEGQKMAQIQDTINPQVLFTSPDALPVFKALINASAKMSAQNGNGRMDMLQKMNDQELQGLLMMVGGVFGKTNVTVTRWIGVDDKLFHALDVEVNLNIDSGMMSGPNSSGQLNGTISFSVQLTKVGQPVTVTAPAGAKMIDPRQLMRRGMGMGMMLPGMMIPRGTAPFPMKPPVAPPAAQATAAATSVMPAVTPVATMAATTAQ